MPDVTVLKQLGDRSNFVRTFRRAAGVSRRRFQALAGRRTQPRAGCEVPA